MAGISFASRLKEDGSVVIPQEAVETLGLHPGDEISVRIETNGASPNAGIDPSELRRRAAIRFAEADILVREPAPPLSDPLEISWAAGVEEKARRMGLTL